MVAPVQGLEWSDNGWRRVLSPLSHPCFPKASTKMKQSLEKERHTHLLRERISTDHLEGLSVMESLEVKVEHFVDRLFDLGFKVQIKYSLSGVTWTDVS